IALLAAGLVFDVMHIDVVDAFAAILPCLASVAAQQYSAMFEEHEEKILVVGMNEDMAHVGLLETSQSRRHIPFLFHVIGKVEYAIQGLPLCACVFAAKQAYRTGRH